MTIRTIGTCWVTAAALMFVSLAAPAQSASILDRIAPFSIPPQSLTSALIDFSSQSGVQVATAGAEISKVHSQGVSGTRPLGEALNLLLDGTGLKFRAVGNTIAIHKLEMSNKESDLLQLARSGAEQRIVEKEEPDRATQLAASDSGEMTVTGSHIRGGTTASPMMTFTREDFDRAGATTAQQFLATLPQVFGGSYSDDTTNEAATSAFASFGSAVDLRGMGAGATLVLVNGRRMAVSGFGNYTDISVIPLGAVERIDILLDGASAAYGSDAISGVINFIMKENYSGAETSLNGGATSRRDAENYQASQTLGTSGSRGTALVSYEYSRRKDAEASDRSFSRNSVGPMDLVPNQERHSVFAQGRVFVSQRLTAFGDFLWSDRHAEYTDYNIFAPELNHMFADVKQVNGTTGLRFEAGNDWEIEFSGSRGWNEFVQRVETPSNNQARGTSYVPSKYELTLAELKATGPLLSLPSGAVKLAAGAGYREDEFGFTRRYSIAGVISAPPTGKTDARSAFAELQVPLIRARSSTEAARLLITAAARYEDYESFGTTLDPKFGVRWTPLPSLALRATYGTSFKAPSLYQLNEAYNGTRTPRNLRDELTGATVRTVVLFGNNADLEPETATTWTAGLDLSPSWWPGFTIGLTWFDIQYDDRIEAPVVPTLDFQFNNSNYAGFVVRRGSISDADFNARVADLLSGRIRITSCGMPLDPSTGACPESVANFGAIMDSRAVNIAQAHAQGTDLALSYRFERNEDSFGVNLSASYLFDYERRLSPSTPNIDLLGRVLFPVDLKARLSASWSRGDWSSNAAANFTNSYRDNVSVPNVPISTWTTVDIGVQYTVPTSSRISWLANSSTRLHVNNVFGSDPPYYAAEAANLGYDPTNADPLGRTYLLSWRKSW